MSEDVFEQNDRMSMKQRKAAGLPVLAEWLLTPPSARAKAGLPATQKGMAELLGVSEPTITVWKRSKELQSIVSSHLRTNFGTERLSKVIDALYDTATGDSSASQVAAAKTLLQWHKEDVQSVSAQDLRDLPQEELDALLKRVLAKEVE